MPVSNKTRQRVYRERNSETVRAKDRVRKRKARAKAKAKGKKTPKAWPDNPGQAVIEWSGNVLKVPPGHRNSGKPLKLPPYLSDPIKALDTHSEVSVLIARKNSKTTGLVVPILSALIGPTARPGFAAAYVSLSREKSTVSWKIMKAITEAAELEGLRFYKSPPRVVSKYGEVEFLSSDKNSGASLSLDYGVLDELGLFSERDRELVNSLRSSTSAKDGKILSLSVVGSSPFVKELIERHERGDKSLALFLHQPTDKNCAVDDEKSWHEANPGLIHRVKSLEHMRRESKRVLVTISDQPSFRSLELNLPGSPSREMLCSHEDWARCEVSTLPPRSGSCVVGIDNGGSKSMSAAVVLWDNGRMETFAAFPDNPSLKDRGQADGVGGLYERMRDRGELTTYAGRLVPVGEFLKDCAARLKGERVIQVGADRYRKSETLQALEEAELNWPIIWRGCGASAIADGSFDVRACQRMIYGKEIKAKKSLLMRSAIAESEITRKDGNPKLQKSRHHSRIDILQSLVIACGLLALSGGKAPQRRVTILD